MAIVLIIVFVFLVLVALLQALTRGDELLVGAAWASATKWIAIAALVAVLFLSWLDRALPA